MIILTLKKNCFFSEVHACYDRQQEMIKNGQDWMDKVWQPHVNAEVMGINTRVQCTSCENYVQNESFVCPCQNVKYCCKKHQSDDADRHKKWCFQVYSYSST